MDFNDKIYIKFDFIDYKRIKRKAIYIYIYNYGLYSNLKHNKIG